MHTLVTDGTITKYFKNPKGFTLGDLQYPKDIFTKWSTSELKAIGIYEVVFDNSNFKNEYYYINTNQSFAFANDTVTASYGSATPKAHADTLFTAQDETDGLGTEDDVKEKGLKTNYKENFNTQAASLLLLTDWYVVKATEVSGYSVPSAITTYRAAVRTKVNAMETAIANCANVAALETLLEYTSNDADPPVTSRPLGEFPDEVV